jgi:hypothetical protein
MTDTSQPNEFIRTLSLLPLVLTPMWCSSFKNIEPVLVRKEPLYIVNLISFCVLVVTILFVPLLVAMLVRQGARNLATMCGCESHIVSRKLILFVPM